MKKYKNNPDLSFDLFLGKINFSYNKHSPLTTSNRKNKHHASKPWLTPGIIKRIRIKKIYINNFVKPLT